MCIYERHATGFTPEVIIIIEARQRWVFPVIFQVRQQTEGQRIHVYLNNIQFL